MSANSEESDDPTAGRYQEIEYQGSLGTVLVIQDTENEKAWIESDVVVELDE